MNRVQLEAIVVGALMRAPKLAPQIPHFEISDPLLAILGRICLNLAGTDRKPLLPEWTAAIAKLMPGREIDVASIWEPARGLPEAMDAAKAILWARDSGKDAPGRDLAPQSDHIEGVSVKGHSAAKKSDGPPRGHPAAESDTPEGEPDLRGEGGFRLRSVDPLQELEAKLTNYDAEQALLAAILANETVYTRVCGIVRPEDMADPLHGRILDACGRLVGKGVIPSPVTLKNLFDQDGALREIGGAQYLVELAQSVVSVLHADDYAHQVADLAGRRHTLAVLERAKDELLDFSQDVNVLVAETMHRLPAGMGPSESGMRTKHQVREEIARYVDQPGVFYPSGLAGVDKLLGGGLFAKKLYGLAARHKAGKSALSMSISHALNAQNTMHGFAALEMSDVELEMRDVASDLQVNSLRLMLGSRAQAPVGGGRVIETMGDLPDATIYFSRPGATMADIRGFILQAISRHKITGVIVDYHQLIGQVDDFTEERHLRESAQALAKMCRQLNIWCLLVLQLNQEGNARGGEGIKLACDAYMTLNRDPGADGAYLSLDLCRYKEAGSMGTATVPGLMLDPHGPHFRDATGPAPELDQAELVL